MNSLEAQKVKVALSEFGDKVKVTKQDKAGDVWKITLPFVGYNTENFRFYIFHYTYTGGKHIYMSDGGALLKTIKGCGEPHLAAIQKLVGSFGLSMMEDLSIMDSTTRPMSTRVMSYLQAWCAVDGVVRVWKLMQEEISNAVRPPSR